LPLVAAALLTGFPAFPPRLWLAVGRAPGKRNCHWPRSHSNRDRLVTVLRARKRSEGHRWIVLQALQIYDAEDAISARCTSHVDGDGLFIRVR
jgi:hypothetical protein